jgi:4-hydroxy 2-oxovalerate aldolase
MVKIIDCTLRDGGYYNNWDFDIDFIQNYINGISDTGIEFSEIGYSSFYLKKTNKVGLSGNVNISFLNKISIPNNLNLGVMINLDNFELSEIKKINPVFNKLNFVRIACNIDNVYKLSKITPLLRKFDLKIFVNLMQIDLLNDSEISAALSIINKNHVDVFYFADSLGSMNPSKVNFFIKKIKNKINTEIGFHPHNNKSLAFANAIYAIKNKIDWIDATIYGMGRGAGNLKTEEITTELNNVKKKFNIQPLYHLIKNKFENLHNEYNWGPNIFYHYSACNRIHPSYVQNILKDDRYTYDEIFQTLNFLKDIKSSNYSFHNLNLASKKDHSIKSSWVPYFGKRYKNILLLGGGESIKLNIDQINSFIQKQKPLVLSVNINQYVDIKKIDYFISCHESRLIFDSHKYKHIHNRLIVPRSLIHNSISANFKDMNLLNYEVSFEENIFQVFDSSCILPNQLSFAYAVAILLKAGFKKINIAGFDGHVEDKLNNKDIDHFLSILYKKYKGFTINTITDSSYNFKQNIK